MNKNLLAAIAGVSTLAFASTLWAHAHLESAVPAADSVVAAPERITLHFSMKIAPKLSGVTLSREGGSKIDTRSAVDAAGLTMTATVTQPLSAGAYKVEWYAVTPEDGHRSTGDFKFVVK